MLLAAFLSRYSEFKLISPGLAQACLDEAATEITNAGDWGNRYDTAHGLLAAWKLWDSPSGATMRLDGGDGKEIKISPYERRYRELVAKTFPAFMVT